ncbi:MAG: ABC transporter permease [Streptosporangiales bacterium]|nr:ABC transporter permease [Streptosporangiales bacterium]
MTALTGTEKLVRLALRRDRILLPVWIAVFVVVAVGSAAAVVDLYTTPAARIAASATSNGTPSLVALYGWIYDPASVGAIALLKLGGTFAALVAVLSIVITVRHTRSEEEAGRLELLGATVVGRHASLAAAMLVSTGTALILGALTAVGLIAAGLPTEGSLAFGAAWASIVISFAAVACVAAQLTKSAKAATGIAVAVLGVTYLLRAIGDTTGSIEGPTAWSWLSPIGWSQQIRPYAGDRWWVLAIALVFSVVATVAAHLLAGRRDLDAGLLPYRLGPGDAGRGLSGPLGLAWRLHRGMLIGWSAGFVVMGLVFGNVASNVGGLLDSPQAREMVAALGGEKGLTDALISALFGIIAVIASAYGVQAALRMRTEETGLRAEPVLATRFGRAHWMAGHLTVALAGTAILMVIAGLAVGAAHAVTTGDADQLGRVLVAAVVRVPAAWVLTGLVVALFGLLPRLAAASWALLVAFVLLGELGPVFQLDQWVMDLSPYAHVPSLPGGDVTAAPLLWLVGITAALILAGLLGFRRRDVG